MAEVIVFEDQRGVVDEVIGPISEEDAIKVLELRGYVNLSIGHVRKYWSKSPGYSAAIMPLTPPPRDI